MQLVPTKPQPKPKRSEVNRAKIIAAATLEFGKDGVKGAKVDAIAASSGLTKRTLYKYFDNKEAIFTELLADFLAELNTLVAVTYDPGEEFDPQLKALIKTYVAANYNDDYIGKARVITCELIKGRPITAEQLRQYEAWQVKLSMWMEHARNDGKLTTRFSPLEIAVQFYSMVKAETFYPLVHGLKANTEDNRELSEARLWGLFTAFYLAPPS